MWRRMRSGLPGGGQREEEPPREGQRPQERGTQTWEDRDPERGDRDQREVETETQRWENRGAERGGRRQRPRDGGTETRGDRERCGQREGETDPEEGGKDVERGGTENWEKGRQRPRRKGIETEEECVRHTQKWGTPVRPRAPQRF